MQGARGHERGVALVVEAAQAVVHHRRKPAEAVIAAVLVEIGSKIGRDRDAGRLRRAQRSPTERAFGGDVHELRPAALEARPQGRRGRQAEAKVGIHRDRAAERAQLVGAVPRAFAWLTRPDQLERMAALPQMADRALHGQGHAIQLGRECLGHVSDAHGGLSSS